LKKIWRNLKIRWGIKSDFQVLIILVVFAITGMTSLRVGHLLLDFIGITKENLYLDNILGSIPYYTLRVISILVVYKFILLIVGSIFGQFNFFWNFIKRFLRVIGFRRLLN